MLEGFDEPDADPSFFNYLPFTLNINTYRYEKSQSMKNLPIMLFIFGLAKGIAAPIQKINMGNETNILVMA